MSGEHKIKISSENSEQSDRNICSICLELIAVEVNVSV